MSIRSNPLAAAVAVAGLALYWMTTQTMFFHAYVDAVGAMAAALPPSAPNLLFGLGAAATGALVAALCGRARQASSPRAPRLAAAVIGALAAAAHLAVLAMSDGRPAGVGPGAAAGVASACALLVSAFAVAAPAAWCLWLGRLVPREGVVVSLLSFMASCCVGAVQLFAPVELSLLTPAAYLLSPLALLWLARALPRPEASADAGAAVPAQPQRELRRYTCAFLAPCLLFVALGEVLVKTLYRQFDPDAAVGLIPGVSPLIALCLCTVVLLYFLWRGCGLRSFTTALIFMSLVFAFMLLTAFFAKDPYAFSLERMAAVACIDCFLVLAFSAVVNLMANEGGGTAGTPVLFALLFIVVPSVLATGTREAGGVLDHLLGDARVGAIAAVALFLVAAGTVAFLATCVVRLQRRLGLREEDAAREACARAAASLGASERERDIMTLAYRGYGARRIGEETGLAESTVRSHLSRVYQRAQVHSRQELASLIDTFRD